MKTGLVVLISTIVLLAVLELLLPRRRAGVEIRRGRVWPVHAALILLFQLCLLLFPALTPVALAGFAPTLRADLPSLSDLPWVFELITTVVVLDFWVTLQHWAFHRFRWLWPFHRVHHSDEQLDFSSAWRFHPVELLLSLIHKGIAVVILAPSPMAVASFELCLGIMALVTHANIRLHPRLDRLLSGLLVTPDFHQIHHHPQRMRFHYGTILSCWDRLLFGYQPVDYREREHLPQGLPELWPNRGLVELLVQPWFKRK